jgi:SM-20-related protein
VILDETELDALAARGFVVKDGFAAELAAAARAEAVALPLRAAGITREARLDREERGDEIAWIEDDAPPALAALRARFEELRVELNHAAYLGLARFDVQVARYPAGARYARHRDAFPGGPNRRLTAIVYLTEGEGGELRLHVDPPLDVAPHPGRLVVFLSEAVEHEVLPARAERIAVTAWYYGREDLPR